MESTHVINQQTEQSKQLIKAETKRKRENTADSFQGNTHNPLSQTPPASDKKANTKQSEYNIDWTDQLLEFIDIVQNNTTCPETLTLTYSYKNEEKELTICTSDITILKGTTPKQGLILAQKEGVNGIEPYLSGKTNTPEITENTEENDAFKKYSDWVKEITDKENNSKDDLDIHFIILENDGLTSCKAIALYTIKTNKQKKHSRHIRPKGDSIILQFEHIKIRQTSLGAMKIAKNTRYTAKSDCEVIVKES